MKFRRLIPFLALLFLTACSDSGPKKPKIGVAFETLQTEFWVAGFDAIKAECAKAGYEAVEAVADSERRSRKCRQNDGSSALSSTTRAL